MPQRLLNQKRSLLWINCSLSSPVSPCGCDSLRRVQCRRQHMMTALVASWKTLNLCSPAATCTHCNVSKRWSDETGNTNVCVCVYVCACVCSLQGLSLWDLLAVTLAGLVSQLQHSRECFTARLGLLGDASTRSWKFFSFSFFNSSVSSLP